jgi:diamine N-acetyltransferase
MSAQAIFTPGASSEGTARTVSGVSLRDDVVAIGPVVPDDIGNLFLWLNDAQAALTDTSFRPVDCLNFNDWLNQNIRQAAQVLFTIRRLQPAHAIGFLQFKNFNPAFRSAEIGLRIGEEADRGKGFGGRALALARDYGWDNLNLRRIMLTAFADNKRAIAAYARAGFREEGVMQSAAFAGGAWHDVVMMAALNPRE